MAYDAEKENMKRAGRSPARCLFHDHQFTKESIYLVRREE